MVISRDKIEAINTMCRVGAVTNRDCGRYTFRWLEKNEIGTHTPFWSDIPYTHSLSPNHKAIELMRALEKIGAFDYVRTHSYHYRTRRAMSIEV